jgi:hypothetical protein
MGLCPLVTPDQLSKFEDFAYDEVIEPKFPNGTAVSSFGKGVYAIDPSLNTIDNRYHESDGTTLYYDSPNKIFAPFLFHSYGGAILMANVHSWPVFGQAIDEMIACANMRAMSENVDSIECGVLTDMLTLFGNNGVNPTGPSALIMQPIYPANDNTEVSYMLYGQASVKSRVVLVHLM